jgi:transposase
MSMSKIMDTMPTDKKRIRRDYSLELKARILAECAGPGASVAKIAMAHGVNANLVHTWRKLARQNESIPGEVTRFVPIAIEAGSATPAARADFVEIELQRGALSLKLRWPASATNELGTWMRELLR